MTSPSAVPSFPSHQVLQTLIPSKILSFPFFQLSPVLVACKMHPKTVNGMTRHTTTPIAIQINAFLLFQLLSLNGESRGLRFEDREVREVWEMGKEELLSRALACGHSSHHLDFSRGQILAGIWVCAILSAAKGSQGGAVNDHRVFHTPQGAYLAPRMARCASFFNLLVSKKWGQGWLTGRGRHLPMEPNAAFIPSAAERRTA